MTRPATNKALTAMEQNITVLREIDMEKLNKDEKSNEVLNFVRRIFIITAFAQSKDLTAGCLYLTGKSVGYIMNSINMFVNRSTEYKHLLNSIELTYNVAHACWKIVYSLNDEAISNNYRRFLNNEYGLDIAMISGDDRIKEIDNNLLKNIGQLCPVTLAEAGV